MQLYVRITYVTEQNADKSTFSMDLLNTIRLEKSSTLRGNAFHMLTTRSAKNSDRVVQLARRLNILYGLPRVLEDCLILHHLVAPRF